MDVLQLHVRLISLLDIIKSLFWPRYYDSFRHVSKNDVPTSIVTEKLCL